MGNAIKVATATQTSCFISTRGRQRVGRNQFTAKDAKSFRKMFYMSRNSPVLRAEYYMNRDNFWFNVKGWFKLNGFEYNDHDYMFLCLWDKKPYNYTDDYQRGAIHNDNGKFSDYAEIILPFSVKSECGMYILQQGDLALVEGCMLHSGSDIKLRNYHHMLSRFGQHRGYWEGADIDLDSGTVSKPTQLTDTKARVIQLSSIVLN